MPSDIEMDDPGSSPALCVLEIDLIFLASVNPAPAECERAAQRNYSPRKGTASISISLKASECLRNWWDHGLIWHRDYAPVDPDLEDCEPQDDEDDDCEL